MNVKPRYPVLQDYLSTDIVYFFDCSEGHGRVLYDRSGNGWHATLQSGSSDRSVGVYGRSVEVSSGNGSYWPSTNLYERSSGGLPEGTVIVACERPTTGANRFAISHAGSRLYLFHTSGGNYAVGLGGSSFAAQRSAPAGTSCVVATWSGGTCSIHVNGATSTGSYSGTPANVEQETNLLNFGNGDSGQKFDAPVYWIIVLAKRYHANICTYISENPLSIFKNSRIPYDIYDSEFAAATGGIPYWLLNQPRQVVGV